MANIAFKAPLLEAVGCLVVSTWTEGWTTGLSRKGLGDCVRVSRKLSRFGRVPTCFALKKVDGGTDIDSFFDFFFCYFLFFFFFFFFFLFFFLWWCCWRWWCCCWCSGVLGGWPLLPGPVLRTWLALDLVITWVEAKLHSNGSNDYLAEVHPQLCDNKESVHIANSKTMLAECSEKPSSARHAV